MNSELNVVKRAQDWVEKTLHNQNNENKYSKTKLVHMREGIICNQLGINVVSYYKKVSSILYVKKRIENLDDIN